MTNIKTLLCLKHTPGTTKELAEMVKADPKELEKLLCNSDLFIPPFDREKGRWELSQRGEDYCRENKIGKMVVSKQIKSLPERELKVFSDQELSDYEAPEQVWIVNGYIPEKGFTFFAGKRSSCKTWTAINLALAVASGKPFLGSFETTKTKVLLLDEESGIDTLKERVGYVKSGMGIKGNLENLNYVSFSGMKLDKPGWKETLEEYIKQNEPRIIIVDSLRRIIAGEENDATTLNQFFTEVARPITEQYGCAWVFVHHLRKGQPGGKSKDIMDELRGSSEFANYADSIMTFNRIAKTENKFHFAHAKSRRAKEQPPYLINMNWEENDGHTISVSFENEGTAEDALDQIDLCCRKISIWLEEENLSHFKTKDAVDAMKEQGFSKPTIERALPVLVGRGELLKPSRGNYIRLAAPKPSNHQTTSDGSDGKEKTGTKQAARETINTIKLYSKDGIDGNPKRTLKTLNILKSDGIDGKLKKWRESESKELYINYLINVLNFTHEEIEKLKTDGRIHEVSPGRLELL